MPPKSQVKLKETNNIESIYQKKEHRQHIYDLPDTYIGSAEQTTLHNAWIFEDETLTQKDINFVPGLYKLFDEVLTNASDHKVRSDTWIKLKQEGK
jgi:DNA topoisomerase-2